MARRASGNGNAATDEHRVAGRAPAFRLFVRASSCAAIALLATAFFFLLHHLGNQLPHDLAAQRIKAEFTSDRPDPGHAKGYKAMVEHCMMSSAALAGAKLASEKAENALRDAVLLRTFQIEAGTTCGQLEAAANGAAIPKSIVPPHYWLGGKALYAIALRYGSVYGIRNLIRTGTHVAYALLAISLFLLSPKMLLVAAPLLAFGAFFSGIEYWAGVANGLPHLWTVLLAAGLALFVRLDVGSGATGERERTDAWSGTAPVYCFAAGTVSSYLYFGDGHTFLAVTWIGMVVWFGCGAPNVAERTRRAASCIVIYGAGIAVCYVLGQAVKAMFLGEAVWFSFRDGLAGTVGESVGGASGQAPSHPLFYLDSFYAAYWPDSWPPGVIPTFVAASALAVSLGLAVFEVRQGRTGLLWGALWIVGLMAICSSTFLVVDDIHHRTARYVFVPLALCLSCLLLSLRTMHWRMSAPAARRLSAVLIGLLVVAGGVSWHFATFKSRAVGKVIERVEDMEPIASSVFDVYLDEDRLVYVKEECGAEDVDADFFLHLYPADVAYLHYHRQPHGFANLDFAFEAFGLRGGGRCAAERILPICISPPCAIPSGWPPYEVVAIATGQYLPAAGPKWGERVALPGAVDKVIRSVDGQPAWPPPMQLAASSVFDVYFGAGETVVDQYGVAVHGVDRLVYVKEECAPEDVDAPFFLHVRPADVADLPPHRRADGYDNLDFSFETYGFHGGGRCAAARILPDYELTAIQTGQHVPGKDHQWSARIVPDSLQ